VREVVSGISITSFRDRPPPSISVQEKLPLPAEWDDVRRGRGVLSFDQIDQQIFDRLSQMVVFRSLPGHAEKRAQQENGALVIVRNEICSIAAQRHDGSRRYKEIQTDAFRAHAQEVSEKAGYPWARRSERRPFQHFRWPD
jgi:hypothetical protein